VSRASLRHWRNNHAMDVILGGLWDETASEGVPSYFRKLLDRLDGELPSFSDGCSGAGGYTEVGPTSLGSDIRHSDRTSREIHAVHDVQPHNLNATLSTRSASDGSDA
jgi:hypothetical protein